jgi:hypothetical protein
MHLHEYANATGIFLFEFHETNVSNMRIFSVAPSVVNENSKTCCFIKRQHSRVGKHPGYYELTPQMGPEMTRPSIEPGKVGHSLSSCLSL